MVPTQSVPLPGITEGVSVDTRLTMEGRANPGVTHTMDLNGQWSNPAFGHQAECSQCQMRGTNSDK